jgi:hypothetical protein
LFLTWTVVSTTLPSIFDGGHSQAFSQRAFKPPTVVTRVRSLPSSLANWKLTL